MKNKQTLNEEFLLKRIPIKTNEKIVSEDLGDLYSSPLSTPYSMPPALGLSTNNDNVNLKLTSTIDGHTIEIKQGTMAVNVANDKFVVLTKNYLSAIIRDIEELKRICTEQERKLSRHENDIRSLSSMKDKVNSLQNRLPSGAFKDGGN